MPKNRCTTTAELALNMKQPIGWTLNYAIHNRFDLYIVVSFSGDGIIFTMYYELFLRYNLC